MKIRHLGAVSVPVVAAALAVLSPSRAFDHRDAPFSIADNAADITDVYAFMRPETGDAGDFVPSDHVVLILNFAPGAQVGQAFPVGVEYGFVADFLAPPFAPVTSLTGFAFQVLCHFTPAIETPKKKPQQIVCDVHGTEVVADVETLDAGPPDQDIRIFAGVRSDPAFADVPAVLKVAGDSGLSALTGAGTNTFQGKNVMSIVVEVSLNNIYGAFDAGGTDAGGTDAGGFAEGGSDEGGEIDASLGPIIGVAGTTSRLFYPTDGGGAK
jgi:hypothetical protein